MSRPYIICHMTTSIDGKITGPYLETEKGASACMDYYQVHQDFHADAYACGRTTMTGSFTGGWYPDLSFYPATPLPREDFIAETDAPHYAVAFDTHGRLGWAFPCIDDDDPGYNQAHVIEVLSEEVPDAFLHYLHQTGISYIFAGKDAINVTAAAEKLYHYFGIKTLLLEGGSLINGSFEKAGLIDELSIIQAPLTEPESDKLLFENGFSSAYDLAEIRQLPASLWIRYKR